MIESKFLKSINLNDIDKTLLINRKTAGKGINATLLKCGMSIFGIHHQGNLVTNQGKYSSIRNLSNSIMKMIRMRMSSQTLVLLEKN